MPMTKEEKREYNHKWYLEHREEKREYDAARYNSNRDREIARAKAYNKSHAAAVEQKRKQYIDRNRERIRGRRAKYRQQHRDGIALYQHKWSEEHKDKCSKYREQRRARVRGALVEDFYRDEIYKRDGGKCHICSKKVSKNNWHLDHIIPLSRGGTHTRNNVAVSCPMCNLKKHTSGHGQLRLL